MVIERGSMIKYNQYVIEEIVNDVAKSVTLVKKIKIVKFTQMNDSIKICIDCEIKKNIYDIISIIKDFANLIRKNIKSIYDTTKTNIIVNLIKRKD